MKKNAYFLEYTDVFLSWHTLVESLTSICASSFPLMLKLQKRPLS